MGEVALRWGSGIVGVVLISGYSGGGNHSLEHRKEKWWDMFGIRQRARDGCVRREWCDGLGGLGI